MPSETLVFAPSAEAALRGAGLAGAAAFLGFVGGETAASSRTTSTVRARAEGFGAFYLKRYRFPSLADRLRGTFRGTLFGPCRADREYENLMRLREKGLPVPEPLAWGARRGLLFRREAFLATRAIDGAERADAFLARLGSLPRKDRSAAVRAAAEAVAALHKAGYTDGTMALRNLLLRKEDGAWKAFKVDCAKGRFRIPPGFAVVEDLAKLDAGAAPLASVRVRLRFLRDYLGGKLGDRAREWIRVVSEVRPRFEAGERVRLTEPGAPLHG
ncbi:MAG: lipopolysaccharide kinase InaA family protein [Planctomycetes bacterium]|jgi:tRNA A-37 threonylcarbamoyl transferase component Bud32|nr:lipopolysaccharide kinase InaA family protein [Planctomycetota bacterium]